MSIIIEIAPPSTRTVALSIPNVTLQSSLDLTMSIAPPAATEAVKTKSELLTTAAETFKTKTEFARQPHQTHAVQVGLHNQTLFNPNQIDAAIGDTVLFNFFSGNHTLTESTLENPCIGNHSFDTGFHQTSNISEQIPALAFTVEEVTPRWFFCRQQAFRPHCNQGMVFSLNPGDQMNTFLDNAIRLGNQFSSPCSNSSESCVVDAGWNGTGAGLLPSGVRIEPTKSVSRANRMRRRKSSSLYAMGVAGIGIL